MHKILISGAPGTGKSVVSTTLSYMIGLPVVRSRPSSEIIYELNLSKNTTQHTFKDLFSITFSSFLDRIQLENRYQQGFISDGSIINNLISMKLFLMEQSKSIPGMGKLVSHKRYMDQCNKMIASLEKMALEYSKKQYNIAVHLISEHLVDYKYHEMYNQELRRFYHLAGFETLNYQDQYFEKVVDKIIRDKNLNTSLCASTALFKAYDEMHFDNRKRLVTNHI
jgi:hypothetical protein